MRQDQHAGDALHRLQRKRPLPLQLLASPFPPLEQFRMPRLCLRKPAFRALFAPLHGFLGPPDLLVGSLKKLRQGKLHMLGKTLDLRQALAAGFLQKRRQGMLVEPRRRLSKRRHRGRCFRRIRRREVPEHTRLDRTRLAPFRPVAAAALAPRSCSWQRS